MRVIQYDINLRTIGAIHTISNKFGEVTFTDFILPDPIDPRLAEVEAERDAFRAALERITKFNFDFLEAFHLSARECREVARAALGDKP